MPNPTRTFVGPGAGYHFITSAKDDWTLGLKVIYNPSGRRVAACEHAADALDIVRALNAWHAGDYCAQPLGAGEIEGTPQDADELEDNGLRRAAIVAAMAKMGDGNVAARAS